MAAALAARLRPFVRSTDPPAPQCGGFRRRHQHHARKVSGHSGCYVTARIRARRLMRGHFRLGLHLVLFVHRVTGLDPGMYLWLRAPADMEALRHAFHDIRDWEAPAGRGPHGTALAFRPGRPARFCADHFLPAGHCRRRRIQPRHAGAIRTGLAGTRRVGLARVVLGVRNDRAVTLSGRRGRWSARDGHWLLLRRRVAPCARFDRGTIGRVFITSPSAIPSRICGCALHRRTRIWRWEMEDRLLKMSLVHAFGETFVGRSGLRPGAPAFWQSMYEEQIFFFNLFKLFV